MNDPETTSVANIKSVRKLSIKLAEKCAEHGVALEDIAIGFSYAIVDLATLHNRDGYDAIAWLRLALNIHEQSILEAEKAGR